MSQARGWPEVHRTSPYHSRRTRDESGTVNVFPVSTPGNRDGEMP